MMKLPNPDNKEACERFNVYTWRWALAAVAATFTTASLVAWVWLHFTTDYGFIAMIVSIVLVFVFIVTWVMYLVSRFDLQLYVERREVIDIPTDTREEFMKIVHEVDGFISREVSDGELFRLQRIKNHKITPGMDDEARRVATKLVLADFKSYYQKKYGRRTV